MMAEKKMGFHKEAPTAAKAGTKAWGQIKDSTLLAIRAQTCGTDRAILSIHAPYTTESASALCSWWPFQRAPRWPMWRLSCEVGFCLNSTFERTTVRHLYLLSGNLMLEPSSNMCGRMISTSKTNEYVGISPHGPSLFGTYKHKTTDRIDRIGGHPLE